MTSFTTPDGTRGPEMRPSGIFRWAMARQVRSVRRRGARGVKPGRMNTLVLTAIGRRSGRRIETPIGCLVEPDGSWLVCAAAGGAMRHPSWYRNLAAAPDRASIFVAGEEIPVRAEELHDAEREAAWQEIVRASPRFAAYARRTDRLLPVIRLTRRAA